MNDESAEHTDLERHGLGPTVCVDFDGVLNLYNGWKGPDDVPPLRVGAMEFLRQLAARGYDVVILTARPQVARDQLAYVVLPANTRITDRKPPANVYIDDRGICFRGDFDETLRQVDEFKAFWEGPAETSDVRPQTSDREVGSSFVRTACAIAVLVADEAGFFRGVHACNPDAQTQGSALLEQLVTAAVADGILPREFMREVFDPKRQEEGEG